MERLARMMHQITFGTRDHRLRNEIGNEEPDSKTALLPGLHHDWLSH